jgi:predicted RNA-binding protein with PUA-like domain
LNYWLIKSEPLEFSFADLKDSPGRRTCWDGVRNYQARNYLRDGMRIGDLAFFYHSSCAVPAIEGIVRVVSEAYPDHTAFDPGHKHYDAASDPASPRWYMVDVRYQRKLKRPITLRELKRYAKNQLAGLALLRRGNRLSVMPVTAEQWNFIVTLERGERVT